MANLTTLSSSELQQLSQREFVHCLDGMSAQAIDRFRKMRTIPKTLNETLEFYLEEHPEKRVFESVKREPPRKAPPAAVQTTAKVGGAGRPASRRVAHTRPTLQDRLPATLAQLVDDYIPFAERFTAWWNGEDIAPNKRVRVTHTPPAATKVRRDPSEIVADAPPIGWTPDRIDIVQRIWGPGLHRPGGEAAALALAKMAGTQEGMEIADLTAGLGGGARAIAREFNVHVTGYEQQREIAEAGMAMSAEAGMAEEVPVHGFEPEEDELPERAYDRIFARELLYTLPRRSILLRNVASALRPGGQFVFTDFVLTDRDQEPSEVAAWRDSEPEAPMPWTVAEYRDSLRDARLDLRNHTDQSEIYVNAVEGAWRRIMSSLGGNPLDRQAVNILMQEGQIWLNRTRALRTGRLQLIRFQTGRKRIRAMNDPLDL